MDISGVKSTEIAGVDSGRGHIVVIGAGMGGLAAAIRLASAGLAVTVLDAAAEPGGKMRTTPSAAGPVDSGPTVLTLRAVFDELFASAGERLDDHLTLVAQDILARHLWRGGPVLDLHPDPERNAAAIRAAFGPRAEAEFRAFTAHAAGLRAAFDGPVMHAPRPDLAGLTRAALAAPRLWRALWPGRTLAADLRARFTDPGLRQLFGRYATYVGGAPGAVPAVLGLIWHVEQAGVWAVRGGMAGLARAMAGLARARGAVLRPGTRVDAIEAPGGQVRAVRLAGGERIGCERVVFNGDPAALLRGLLGRDVQAALPRRAVAPRSLSARVWAFAAQPSGVDLALHTVFFADAEADEFPALAAGTHPVAPTIYVCAQDRAGPDRAAGPERFEMILNAPPLPHAQPPNPDEAQTCRTTTFDRLARFGLSFDPLPQAGSLTRPQDFAALFPGSDGALYGRSPQGMLAPFARPGARTRVSGLYLAGGGAHPGAGVPMATLSGRHAAEAIMTDRGSTFRSARTVMPGGMSTA